MALLIHKHLASLLSHWPFHWREKRACYVNGSRMGAHFVNCGHYVDFFFLTTWWQNNSQFLKGVSLWWVSVLLQPWTTCHEHHRTLRQPPRHTSCLGRSNVDLWRRAAARSRWPPSCWAMFGLMNKRSPQTKTDLSWHLPHARGATRGTCFSRYWRDLVNQFVQGI